MENFEHSLKFDPENHKLYLPDNNLHLDFSKSDSSKYYFFLLNVIMRHILKSGTNDFIEFTPEIDAEIQNHVGQTHTSSSKSTLSISSLRRLKLQGVGVKSDNPKFYLHTQCPYEIIHTPTNLTLPFKSNKFRLYQHNLNEYNNLLKNYGLDNNKFLPYDTSQESKSSYFDDIFNQYRLDFSKAFQDKLICIHKFIFIKMNGRKIYIKVNREGAYADLIKPPKSRTPKCNSPGKQHKLSIKDPYPPPPDYFSFDYIKGWVKHTYGPDNGFLVIRFGSSVQTNHTRNRDEDFLILVHGNHYWGDNAERIEQGPSHIPALNNGIGKPIDLRRQLFDSFLTAIITGLPFEVSVALNGKCEHAFQMHAEYWNWLQTLVSNHYYNSKYLINQLRRDERSNVHDFVKARNEENNYDLVIATYHLACVKLQIKILCQEATPNIVARQIDLLSKWNLLSEYINNRKTRNNFCMLVDYFKRNTAPENRTSLVNFCSNLIQDIDKEMPNA